MLLGMNTVLKHETPEEWAETIRSLGCRAAVFPVDYKASEKTICAYQKAAEDYGIVIAEVGIWANPLAEDPKERRAARERSFRQLELAEEVRARCCGNVAGAAAGPGWDGAHKANFTEEAKQRTLEFILELLDKVKPEHTAFTLEPMPWMLPSGPEDYLELLRSIKRSDFAVHLDIINMIHSPERYFFAEDFTDKCFELLGPYIRSCHLKDIKLLPQYTFMLEEKPCGEGVFNIEHFARTLDHTDPGLPVLIEHLPSDEAYIESIRYLKKRLGKSGLWPLESE